MVKGREETIEGFNETVNMTLEELQAWMDNPRSEDAGLGPGQESGRKIIEILKHNPSKDPSKYRDEDIDHMRKVVSYNKRHLAQERSMKERKSPEELEKTKSTISLRNWGHDPLKTIKDAPDSLTAGAVSGGKKGGGGGGGKKAAAKKDDAGEDEAKGDDAKEDEAPKKRGRPKKEEAADSEPAEKKTRTSGRQASQKKEEPKASKPASKGGKPKSAGKGKPASKAKA